MRTRELSVVTALCGLVFATTSAGAYSASVQGNLNYWWASVPAGGYGVHTGVYDGELCIANSTLPALLQSAGANALRYPGGSYSDAYQWLTNSSTPYVAATGDSAYAPIYVWSNDDFENFMTEDVIPSNSQAIITVNYGSNEAGTGGGDPNSAAAWVKYANVTNKYGIKYWEIGNEVGGNGYFADPGWELDLHYPYYNGERAGQPSLSQASYGQNALPYISAMKAVDPTIKTGVGIGAPGTNAALLTACGAKIDFVIIHWYPAGSIAAQLGSSLEISGLVAAERTELAQYCGSNASNIQILVTETSGGGPSTGAPPALFAADDYLTWFENGAQNVDWLELHNGFLSESVSGVPDNTPAQPYYGMQLDSTIARPGDNLDQVSSNNVLLSAHFINRYDGTVAMELINKDPVNSATVTVTLNNVTLASTGTRYDFGAANFSSATDYAASGIAKSTISGIGQNSFTITVPAYTMSAVLVTKTSVKDYSVSPVTSPLTLSQGGSTSTAIDVTSDNGFTGSVGFSASGLPSGVSASFSPTSSTTATTLKLTAASSAATGIYPITITGTSGSLTHATTVLLTVLTSTTYVANGTHMIENSNSGLVVDDPGWATSTGTQIDQWTGGSSANQEWKITNLGSNEVSIINSYSGLALAVVSGSQANGAAIDQETYAGALNQEWLISPAAASGYYILQNRASGLALDVPNWSKATGVLLDQWTTTGGANQEWEFE